MKTIKRKLNANTIKFIEGCNKSGITKSVDRKTCIEISEKYGVLYPQYIMSTTYGGISEVRGIFLLPDVDGNIEVNDNFDESTYKYLDGATKPKSSAKKSKAKKKVKEDNVAIEELEVEEYKGKTKRKKKVNDSIDEPIFTGILPEKIKATKGRFFSYHREKGTHSRMVAFIREFLDEVPMASSAEILNGIGNLLENDWTIAIACRCYMKLKEAGYEKSDEAIEAKKYATKHLLEYRKTKSTPSNIVDKKSVFEYMKEKARQITSQFDVVIDDFVQFNKKDFDVKKYLDECSAPAKTVSLVRDMIDKSYKADFDALATGDELFLEGYNITAKEGKEYKKFLDKLLDDIQLYIDGTKATSSKKTKAKVSSKIKLKVQYKVSDSDYNIASTSPEKILGKGQCWLFNTKSRELQFIDTNDVDGIVIKGTTIQNVDKNESFTIRLRKPQPILEAIKAKKKRDITNALNGIKTKRNQATGRINKYTIIMGG